MATTGSTTANITPRPLTIDFTGVNKVYDGGNTASVTTATPVANGFVTGDVFDINWTANYADKNVGGAKPITVSAVSLSNPAGSSSTDATNYTVASTGSATANITPRALNVYYTGVDRVYDGSTVASVTTADDRVLNDVLTINWTASYADKNVGTNKAITMSGVSLSSTDANNYNLTALSLTPTAVPKANITAAPLTIVFTGVNKVYDGLPAASVTTVYDDMSTPNAARTLSVANGYVDGDVLSVNRTATFVDNNVGTGVGIQVTGISLGGADAANYKVVNGSGQVTTTGTSSADITAKPLSAVLVGSIQKTYDGGTGVSTLSPGNYSLSGFVTVNGVTEGATVTQTQGTFNDRNVLLANSVTATLSNSHFTPNSGTSLSNYSLPTSATGAGSINPSPLTVVYTGVNRDYDGSTTATVTTSLTAPNGFVPGDDVSVVRSASFDNKNIGSAKPISVYNVSLSGNDASNYTVSSTGSTSANVTRQNSVTWVGGASGEWFDPANWAVTSNPSLTGAVPDLNNVKNVVVPQGRAVSFDDSTSGLSGSAITGTVLLDALTYQGAVATSNFSLKNGVLVVTGNATLGGFESLAGTSLTVNNVGATPSTLSVNMASGVTQTMAGALNGSAGLSKAGAGTLVLTGGSAYTGGTTIAAGILQVGVGGTAGNLGTGTITNNGTLVYQRSDNFGVADVITGSGVLRQEGTGMLTLSGANSYTGATFINAGTLGISSDANLGTAPSSAQTNHLVMGNGGSLYLYPVFTTALNANRGIRLDSGGGTVLVASSGISYAGVMAGTGSLTKSGSGMLTLSGANTYAGGTTVAAGTLQVGVASVGSVGAVTSGALGTGDVVVAGGSALHVNGYHVLNGLSVSGTGVSSSGVVYNTTATPVTLWGPLTLSGDSTVISTPGLTLNTVNGGVYALTATAGTGAGNGDLTFNGPVAFSGENISTFTASRNIRINASMSVNGSTSASGITLKYNQANGSGDYSFGLTATGSGASLAASFNGAIDFASTASTFTTHNYTTAKNYTLVDAFTATGASTNTLYWATAANCSASNSLNFALAKNINASTFTGNANLRGLGNSNAGYASILAGLGHSVTGLSLSGSSNVGLFNATASTAQIRDLRLSGITLSGGTNTGALVANAANGLSMLNVVMDAVTASNTLSSTGNYLGALVGTAGTGTLNTIYVLNTPVSGASYVGGVLGSSSMSLTNVQRVGGVTGTGSAVGGLVGNLGSGSITSSSSSGADITGASMVGGLVGYTSGTNTITTSTTSNNVTGTANQVGGLVGYQNAGNLTINGSGASGNIQGTQQVGGLLGYFDSRNTLVINPNSYAQGTVTGTNTAGQVGGLVGAVFGNVSIYGSNYSGAGVSSQGPSVGGLLGENLYDTTDIRNSYVNSPGVTGVQGAYQVGGMVGRNGNWLTVQSDSSNTAAYGAAVAPSVNAKVVATTSSGNNAFVGGVVGWSNVWNSTTTINDTHVTSALVSGPGAYVGGLVGYAYNLNTNNSYVDGTTISATGNYVGGLVGNAYWSANLSNVYVNGDVSTTGSSYVAGLLGNMGQSGYTNGGKIVDAYYTGNITVSGATPSHFGGLVGYMIPGTWISNSYYDIDNSKINSNKVVTPGGLYTGQYTAWAQQGGASVVVTPSSRAALNIANYLTADTSDATGNTYLIRTVAGDQSDLSKMLAFVSSTAAGGVNAYTFKLANDIDMATVGTGTPYVPYFGATAFKGNTFAVNNFSFNRQTSGIGFLGMVHKSSLSDVWVNAQAYTGQTAQSVNGLDYVGAAVGALYNGAISNSSVRLSANVNGVNYVGGLAGYVGQSVVSGDAALRASATTGGVAGTNKVGGLAGWMEAVTGANLNSDVPVSGATQVGGLIGEFYGTATLALSNASASGAVTGSNTHVGGLIGVASGSAFDSLSATGLVTQTGGYRVGGLIGYFGGATLSNSWASGNVVATATSGGAVGGLIGEGNGTSITASYATGSVTSSGSNVGGLVGTSVYHIIDSYATGTVQSTSNNVGGLVGYSYRNVSNSYASGNVTVTGTNASNTGGLIGYQESFTVSDSRHITGTVTGMSVVGGLIGATNSAAVIKGSYTTRPVVGSYDYVGGLVGKLAGTIQASDNIGALPTTNGGNGADDSYAAGSVTGRNDVGGLVGRMDTTAVVKNAFATGAVSADANYGGLVGFMTPGATLVNAHYNIDAVSITGLTPASPSTRVAVSGLVTSGGLWGTQYNVWFHNGALDGLATTDTTRLQSYFGSADSNGYYALGSVQQLKDYLGYADQASLKFKLANDITLESGLFVPYVSGYFDPNGKTINNLSLSQNTSNLGFIGYLNGRTTTQALNGLSMSSASVLGKLNVGTQVGASYLRAITLATSSGSVTGADLAYQLDPGDAVYSSGSNSGAGNAGGIVGVISASNITTNALDSATSSVTVSGGSHVGGLVGRLNTGTLTNSTASGAVSGVSFVGGLVGRQYYGSLTGSSATNAVTATGNYTGGLVGYLEHSASSLNTSAHTTGLVKGVSFVGGLIGQSEGTIGVAVAANTPTYSTFVTSNLEASGSYVGGLIGYAYNGTVTNTSVSGSVTGVGSGYSGDYVGGLIGQSQVNSSWNRYIGPLVKGSSNTGG